MLAACLLGALTIATAISLSGGAPQYQKLPEMLKFGGMVALANTSLALLAISVIWIDPLAVWLLIVPLATLFLAYRAYISEREKHDRLELLYQSSRIMQHSPELDSALIALLDHARAMFRAEIAEVIIYARAATATAATRDALWTTSIQDAPAAAMVPVRLAADDPVHRRIATERQAFFNRSGPATRSPPSRSARRWSAR